MNPSDRANIRVGIVGYGNLGKGVEAAIEQNSDMELVGVFTRRAPETLVPQRESTKVFSVDALENMTEDIDVLLLCGGSATDLPEMTPCYAQKYHVIDSFDTHAKIPEHFAAVEPAAKKGGKVAIISVGWDPGLFSLHRVLAEAVLPEGSTYTFWGKGISQGHSDAVRRVEGVADARQYTIPSETALAQVRTGDNPQLSTREKHTRVCYVVAKKGADQKQIEYDIVTMPDYFADYDTTVHFISQQELLEYHSGLPHGGLVIRSGETGLEKENNQIVEFKLALDSNPEFTASILTAYARAAFRLGQEGQSGCKTVFDIPAAYLIQKSDEEIRRTML